jgi:Spy/CpxP family protein refolding chaperone
MNKKNGEMNFNKNSKSHMMKSSHKMKKGMPVLRILKNLNLTAEQRTSVKEIMMNSKKNKKSINTAFTKNSFNKNEFIKTMSEKRENMIKSKAEMIEKVYAVLDNKQKEQFKVLIDLRTEKMKQRFN